MHLKTVKNLVVFVIILSVFSIPSYALVNTNYVLDKDNKTQLPIPLCYEAKKIYSVMDDGTLLNNPSDFYVDNENNLFIADTNNNRIVKINQEGKLVASYTCNNTFNSPRGIFVSKSGDLFVSDSGNQQIVHLDQNGEFIEKFIKPESKMIEKNMNFSVGRLRISNQGYLMILAGTKFMSIESDNQFKGYIGSNVLGFSLKRLFIRAFASKEQKSKLLKDEPIAYNSFDIGNDGIIYAVTAEDQSSGQIRKINAVGENVYPNGVYGEKYYNKHTKSYNSPRFVSICVNDDNIIFVLEQYSGHIYAYDQEGTMLCCFGGLGNIKGTFVNPTAIDTDSNGNIYVLDSGTGYVHIFSPTSFIKHIFNASSLYNEGKYDESGKEWENVLKLDVNYNVANLGYSRCLYKLEKFKSAEYYAKLAGDKNGFGMAFTDFRYKVFQDNFGIIVLVIIVLTAIVLFSLIKFRKCIKLWRDNYYNKKDG